MNGLTAIMMRKIDASESLRKAKKGVISRSVVSASKWLRDHEQTENGKSFIKKPKKKIKANGKDKN